MKDKLRLGLIGVGSVVREIYQYLYFQSEYRDLIEIVAIADPNDGYRDWFGDSYDIPAERRFTDYPEMLEQVALDAVQVNTPDHLHADATVAAVEAGLDVLVPKPTAATIADADRMIRAAREHDRFLAIDYHKREDPRIKEAEARYQRGHYGSYQHSTWYMLDKLLVADPNHDPPFFASADFAEKNTCISFLTVHMADALMKVVRLTPVEVRATGWRQKLPSLRPLAVDGYDMCAVDVLFANGGLAHIVTGWHLPNTAYANTVQSSRIVCTDGMIDLRLDQSGIHEIHPDGIFEVNSLFKNFTADGTVTGYGMSSPGRLFEHMLAFRNGAMDAATRERLSTPIELGLFTTAICQAGEESLAQGEEIAAGVVRGPAVKLRDLFVRDLGEDAAADYFAER